MRSVRFWGLSGLPEIRDLIIRQVPVNQEMMFWEDVSQDTVSHNYIVRSVHKEEGVTWDCGAIWFRYENIIIDNGPPESWSCSVTHFRVLPSRSSELHIGCNVMITASLTRRHNDACYETWRPDNFTSHPRHSRHRPGQSITARSWASLKSNDGCMTFHLRCRHTMSSSDFIWRLREWTFLWSNNKSAIVQIYYF